MSDLNVAISVIGGLILGLSLIVGLLKGKPYLPTQPLIAVLVGVLIGPEVLGVLRLANWGDPMTILEQVARFTIAFSVLAAALRIPRTYFSDQPKAMGVLLSVGQLAMAGVSGLLVYVLLGVPFWVAMLVGAILTPTDPVLASTIVQGETAEQNISDRLKHMLSGESGANDGGAYPLVFLAIFVIEYPFSGALTRWVTQSLLWDVAFAVLVGLAIGAVAGKAQDWSLDHDYINETPLFTVTIGLGLLVLGVVHWLGSDGVLAVFVAGLAFNRVAPGDPEIKEENATETVEHLFTIPIFVLFGMALPRGRVGRARMDGTRPRGCRSGVPPATDGARPPTIRPARSGDRRRGLCGVVRPDRRRRHLLRDAEHPRTRDGHGLGRRELGHRRVGAGLRRHDDAAHRVLRARGRQA